MTTDRKDLPQTHSAHIGTGTYAGLRGALASTFNVAESAIDQVPTTRAGIERVKEAVSGVSGTQPKGVEAAFMFKNSQMTDASGAFQFHVGNPPGAQPAPALKAGASNLDGLKAFNQAQAKWNINPTSKV
jgi:hypothetical protein